MKRLGIPWLTVFLILLRLRSTNSFSDNGKVIGEIMKKISTPIFTIGVQVFSFCVLAIGETVIKNNLFDGEPPEKFYGFLGVLFLGLIGSSGIVNIVRKEATTLNLTRIIRGRKAVVWGIVWMVICYVPMLFLLFLLFL